MLYTINCGKFWWMNFKSFYSFSGYFFFLQSKEFATAYRFFNFILFPSKWWNFATKKKKSLPNTDDQQF
jgi:hypothetical protein